MISTRKILAGAFAATALAASSVYAADTATPDGRWNDCARSAGPTDHGADAGRGHRMTGSHRSSFGHGNPQAMVAGHLAALKVELKITRDQENAWEKFAATAGRQAESMPAQRKQMFEQMSGKDIPAPERLAKRTELAKQQIAAMETMTAAVSDLYAALTPEQKKIADDLLARGPMGGSGGMDRRHGHRS